jgi:multidrug resistance efflux pump
MSTAELRPEPTGPGKEREVPQRAPSIRNNAKTRLRVVPILVTLGTVAAAAGLAWPAWQVYMGSPWTRDATVRAYVVTMAPEVSGRIVKLAVGDNQLVHKGDDLLEIDPSDYRIALQQRRLRRNVMARRATMP